MSVDIATLGIKVDSRPVKDADRDLTNLTATGRKTEGALGGVSTASGILGKAMLLIPALAVGAAFSTAVAKAKEFSTAMLEVSTLVDTTTFKMDALTDAILKQSGVYNSSATTQAKAAYQIISAGASSAEEAIETLTAANKLAVGGVTDVATAADGLTSVMNAYGDKVQGATAVSDAMFVGMRAGKTTIAELSGSLGVVAPLAATMGVSFDEVVASLAALTKGGINTRVATTGLRAILAAVAKPSDEAAKLALKLGIEFNSAAIQAKGLTGFLEDLKTKTHGNSDALAILFGGVEALVPVLALSGEAGGFFTEIMEGMKNKTGQTDEAFEKMASGPAYRLGVIFATLSANAIKMGMAFLDFINPALGALANYLTGAEQPGWKLDAAMKALAATVGVIAVRAIMALTASLYGMVASALAGSTAIMGFSAMVTTMGVRAAVTTAAMTGLAGAGRVLLALMGGPLGIAVMALAGGIYYLAGHTKGATTASGEYAKVQNSLAKENAEVKAITDALAGATGQARVEAIKAAHASHQLSIQRVQQAKTALIAAMAERELAAAAASNASKTMTLGMADRRGGMAQQMPGQGAQKWAEQAEANEKTAISNLVERTKILTNMTGVIRGISAGPEIDAPKLDLNTDDPKKNGGKKAAGMSDAQREYETAIKSAKEYAENLAIETSEIGKNALEIKWMNAQRAASAVLKVKDSAETRKLADDILSEAQAYRLANQAQANIEFQQDYADKLDQMKHESTLVGKSAKEIEKANYHRAVTIAIREADRKGVPLDIANIQKETDAIMNLIDAKYQLNEGLERAKDFANTMSEAAEAVNQMTEGFGELFGTAGEGFSNLINTIFEYGDAQAQIAERQTELDGQTRDGITTNIEDQREYDNLTQESARNRIASYGNMIGAAKTFFKEGSTGWKIMEGAERAYRLFQFAMQAKAIIMDVLQTGSSVANSGVRAAASGTEAVAKAMASIPPPFNFVVAGAVIAFLVAMGVKMAGGKGKGASSASSGSSSAAKAVEQYKGPRDEYGNPTSSYSVLKPGSTTVAGQPGQANWEGAAPAAAGGSGSFRGGDLIINGGADRRTAEELQTQFQAWNQKTVEDARRASAADRAAAAGRQQIGGSR